MTPEQLTPTVNDLIILDDAIAILEDEMPGHYLSKKTQIVAKLRALTAYEVEVRELEWRKVAPYGMHEAYGLCWKYQIREGTDTIVRWQAGHMGTWFEDASVDAAKAAAQSDHAARIRSALTAAPAADVAGLVEAAKQMLIEYDEVDLDHAEPSSMTAAVVELRAALARKKEAKA